MGGSRRALAVGLLCVLGGLTLAGCGGGKADAAKSDKSLEEQIGIDDDGIRLKQTAAENLIRDCMKTQGFDYVPQDPAAQQAALVGNQGMSKEDFEKQYGYGITTLYEQRHQLAVAGPNRALRDSLSDADRKAYDHALYGDDPTATFVDALDTGDYSRLGGCVKTATEQVFGGADVLQSLSAKLDELDQKERADARMVKAVKDWSACMREKGFDGLSEQEEVDAVLKKKLEEIVGPAGDLATGNAEADYDKAALAALQKEEVSMVKADTECEEEHVESVEEKVAHEYEEAFRADNAGLLSKVPRQ
jgi:outer membrane murein-binding lipoprotein Lpp